MVGISKCTQWGGQGVTIIIANLKLHTNLPPKQGQGVTLPYQKVNVEKNPWKKQKQKTTNKPPNQELNQNDHT